MKAATFMALMEAKRKRERGQTLTEEEQALLAKYPDPPEEKSEPSLAEMFDELEKLPDLPERGGLVFLAGVPRSFHR